MSLVYIGEPAASTLRRSLNNINDWKSFLNEAKIEFNIIYGKTGPKNFSRHDFDFVKTIGTGAFGRVYLAMLLKSGIFYAIKVLDKSRLVKSKQVNHTINERNILLALNFPLCVNLEMSFMDNSYLYLAQPFVAGGEMFTYLRKFKKFKEDLAKFYGAQIALAFEYLHHLDMIYRDLKPENILIDNKGYLKLTDFGFCKVCTGRTYTVCGTPEYLAPEMISNKGYGRTVDWWAYGILLFEMNAGYPPFQANEPIKIYEKVMTGKYKIPNEFSKELSHLVQKLLMNDMTLRYGVLVNGVTDIKDHEWFESLDWLALFNGRIPAPFVPLIEGDGDSSNFVPYKEITLEISRRDLYGKEFIGF